MILLKKLLPVLCLTAPLVSNNAMAAETCLASYLGDKFRVAQIEDFGRGTCIYSASAIYNLRGKVKPVFGMGSRWKHGHGGWYCKPKSGNPTACRFKAINN